MKKNKLIIKIIIVLLIVCGIIIFMWLRSLFGPYSSQKKIEREFYKNYETILEITSYIENTGFENVNIQATDYIYDDGDYGTWYVKNGDVEGVENIENQYFVEMISELFNKRKYQVIAKNENTIYFQLSANIDAGSGVAYSIDGSEPTLQFLTKSEKMDKENWYYYEENFNEWKRLNE